ncbi:MAG: folylpolyglutamate synthase/dihydrofolate synthase family protein [Pseudomonadota bacterium]
MTADAPTARRGVGAETGAAPVVAAKSARREHSDVILERLLALHPKSIDLSLERLERLLARLGHPERALPPVVHVAGTNGKGSTCAYIRAGLEAAGHEVHVYSSPHLTRFHERIRIAGRLIDEGLLADLLAECEEANGGAPITFFEITTAAAFLAFARTPADFCVLEVGLGGRLDATNVIGAPRLAVLTPIDLDHQQFLGDTIDQIAQEKAGILKPGATAVVGPQHGAALDEIERTAARLNASLVRAGQEFTGHLENGRLLFQDDTGLLDLPPPRLFGRHQIENAATAVAALRALDLPEEACAAAMTRVEWPARLQRLRRGPLFSEAPPDSEIWLDGGHNPAAGAALAEHFAVLEEQSTAPLFLLCGMLNTKDPGGFLRPFAGLARRVIAVSIPDEPNALPASEIAAMAVREGLAAQTAGSLGGALRAIGQELIDDLKELPPRIVICGSLYLAGQILRDHT